MSNNSNLPDYQELFGDLDFKKGEEARSVYSPAAYLADLLQLIEDEFDTPAIGTGVDERRSDIKEILLNEENTYTEIPFLNIVNRVLEKKIGGKATDEENLTEVYQNILPSTNYPFNLPFNLNETEIQLYLKYLGISAEELYKLFATDQQWDESILVREYLGMDTNEVDIVVDSSRDISQLNKYYGFDPRQSEAALVRRLSDVKTFLEVTGISGKELRELLFQNLSEQEIADKQSSLFYINQLGYAALNSTEDTIIWKDGGDPKSFFWRVNSVLRLVKKTGFSLTDLDHILRLSDTVDDLDHSDLRIVSTIKKIKETTELPLDEVIAIVDFMNDIGHSDEKEPHDLFNKIFNAKYVKQDKKYISSGNTYKIPHQYITEGYTELSYADDLFHDDNIVFRKRILHAVGISKTDLEKIIQRLDDKKVNSDLWMKASNKKGLLNFLYRFTKLSQILDISHEEVFTLFDVLEQDSSILSFNQHNTFFNHRPDSQNCYTIFLLGSVDDKLWLVQTIHSLVKWMMEYDFTADLLWYIATGKFRTEKAEMTAKELTISQLEGVLDAFKKVEVTPAIFEKGNFDTRSASVIFKTLKQHDHGICKRTHKLVHKGKDAAAEIATQAIPVLGKVYPTDFQGLGIEEPLVEKIKKNLTYKGYTTVNGIINVVNLPEEAEDFKLETDFSYYLKDLFEIIHQLYKEVEEETPEEDEVAFSIFLSDLRSLPLFEEELEELYDNLIFNHYIDEEGSVKFSNFFSNIDNATNFDINTHIVEHSDEVYKLLKHQSLQFKEAQLKLTSGLFDELELSEVEVEDLMHDFVFNGLTNEQGIVLDKTKLLVEDVESFRLALQFYPKRKQILHTIQNKVKQVQKEHLVIRTDKLTKIAGKVISNWAFEDLQGDYLDGNTLIDETKGFFLDTDNQSKLVLGYYFEEATGTAVFQRMQDIIEIAKIYQFTDAPLIDLKFTISEINELLDLLIDSNLLTYSRHIPVDKIDYFINSDNAIEFSLENFEDFNKEVFFLLQSVAKETKAAHQQISDAILDIANKQEDVLWEQLQGIFGLDKDTITAVSNHVFEGVKDIKVSWLAPIIEVANSLGKVTKLPIDKAFTTAFQRIRQYSVLANKLQLGAKETEIAFGDQDLVAKYAESLAFPEGVTKIDALLEASDFIYLFFNSKYWTYRRSDYTLVDIHNIDLGKDKSLQTDEEKEIIELLCKDEKLKDILEEDLIRKLFKKEGTLSVNASFIDKVGNTYVVSGDHYYLWMKDGDSWSKRKNEFGQVDNAFAEISRVDASYIDEQGRLFLFADDLYIRYSNINSNIIDKGYPKNIQEHWQHEGLSLHVPQIFPNGVDAAFEGLDGETYFFRGNKFISSRDEMIKDIARHWGKSKYDFKDIDYIDAAFTHKDITYVFIEDQVTAFADCLENDDIQEVDGFPKRIQDQFMDIPAEFVNGIDAAFVDVDIVHIFKDEHSISLEADANGIFTVKPSQIVTLDGLSNLETIESIDAAMVGLDGYTYMFSGENYIRYKTGNYKQVDQGYPKLISKDWEGLTTIKAAFVLDGKTYVFGEKDGQQVYVRYSTKDYDEKDKKEEGEDSYITPAGTLLDVEEIEVFPAKTDDNFWSLPESLINTFTVDAVLNAHDGKTYLFSGNQVIEFDNIHRWWSEPKSLYEQWPQLPTGITKIDAALAAKDGKTYLFFGDQYIRFSDKAACHIDHGYPRAINTYWGNVKNNLKELCRVDAAVTLTSREEDEDKKGYDLPKIETVHTYLFSGDQFFRYKIGEYTKVELGYPKSLDMLKEEPRFKALEKVMPNSINAVIADERTVYIFDGNQCHIISDEEDIVHDKPEFTDIKTTLIEEGSVYMLEGIQWKKVSALEGETVTKKNQSPKTIQEAPSDYKTDLDSVLQGTDGNTYYFKGEKCYNALLGTEYHIENQWGKPQNTIYDTGLINAGFVGRDGNTYVFSGTQYYKYTGTDYIGTRTEEPPKHNVSDWGGITEVALAYTVDHQTFLFEKADQQGNFRYVVYKTDDYILEQPKMYYGDYSFWGIPLGQQEKGFNTFDTVFRQGDNLIFIKDQNFIRYHLQEKNWSYPIEISLLYPGIPFNKVNFKKVQTAFKGSDDKTYFFDEMCFVIGTHNADGTYTFSSVEDVKQYWGLVENPLLNKIDATLVDNGTTYLFSGNEYVRYSNNMYAAVDRGYPKDIDKHLREETPFKHMGDKFQYELDKISAGTVTGITGVITNERNTYVLINNQLHVGSKTKLDAFELSELQSQYNAFQYKGQVDAAFVKGNLTYLFCDDQYVRYTGNKYDTIDPAYPKQIEEDLAAELGVSELPEDFKYGIDAIFADANKVTIFKDDKFWLSDTQTEKLISEHWGTIQNNFENANKTIDAAYTDKEGKLYVFKGNQFVCYSDTTVLFSDEDDIPKYVDASYPKLLKEHKAMLPIEFVSGINGAFMLEDKLYTVKGDQYAVSKVDMGMNICNHQFYPQPFDKRWGDWSDYLLMDIYLLARLMRLNTKYSSSDETLISLLVAKDGYTKEPYYALSEIFGFDKEDIRWVKQQNTFLTRTNALEDDFEIETIIRLYDILSTTERIKVEVKKLYAEVWQLLYGTMRNAKDAASNIYAMLGAVDYNDNYATLFDQIDRELNTIKRNALVPYAILKDEDVDNTRDLYEKLLIDTQMEGDATTSMIKEATMAIQLFFHRYFMNLEEIELKGNNPEDKRDYLREQWSWMRNYRVWEANRKVFLYPENYIRPELRGDDLKTPAFKTLEQDLMQGEITDDAAQRVYNKYLDEFTEVSRLKIAGGYMYDDISENNPDQTNKKLVMLGRTKTDPYRYYYRFGNFLDGQANNDSWEPWKAVNITIEADRVYPVYAFNKVFMFWSRTEPVPNDDSSTTIVDNEDSNTHDVSSAQGGNKYTTRIYYSYYNLNKEWIQPQLLRTSFEEKVEVPKDSNNPDGPKETKLVTIDHLLSNSEITDVELYVEYTSSLGEETHDNIVVSCKFNHVVERKQVLNFGFFSFPIRIPVVESVTRAFNLTPELYTQRKQDTVAFGNKGKEVFERLFDEGTIEEQNVVPLNTAANSLDAPWFAYDHKGGSFLCKPKIELLNNNIEFDDVPNNLKDINAAFEYNGISYYFVKDKYFTSVNSTLRNISENWGFGTVPARNFTRVTSGFNWTNGLQYILDEDYCTICNGENLDQQKSGNVEIIFENNLYEVLGRLGYTGSKRTQEMKSYKIVAAYALLLRKYDTDFYTQAPDNNDFEYPERVHFSVEDEDGTHYTYILNVDRGNGGNLELTTPAESIIDFVDNSHNTKGWSAAFSMSSQIDEGSQDKEVVHYQFGFKGKEMKVITQTSKNIENEEFSSPELYSFQGVDYRTLNREITAACKADNALYIFDGNEYIVIYISRNERVGRNSQYPEIIAKAINEWRGIDQNKQKTPPVSVATKSWLKSPAQQLYVDKVDAAYVTPGSSQKLVFIIDRTYVTYTLTGSKPDNIDGNQIKLLDTKVSKIDAAFGIGDQIYLFQEGNFYTLDDTSNYEPGTLNNAEPIKGNWSNLPGLFAKDLDAAFTTNASLTLYKNEKLIEYNISSTDNDKPKLYRVNDVPYEVIRLTSSTANDFNRLLFQNGVDSLLQLTTQQIDETPSFSYDNKDATTIKVKSKTLVINLPVGSHIDYNSANGIYYWEVFFQAPFLIAMSLNTDQKFEKAKEWFEHIYDPTAAKYFWKFLPFQAVDIDALIEPAKQLIPELTISNTFTEANRDELKVEMESISTELKKYDDELLGHSTADSIDTLENYLKSTSNDFSSALSTVEMLINDATISDSPEQQLLEIMQLMMQLPDNYRRMQNTKAQINRYLNDPFDPHAIAGLRSIAYRKAIVMSYIDNLLDWGDMLFRQYTRESINEARMLYILAYDLLGRKPENLGKRILSEAQNYEHLAHNIGDDDYDFLFLLDLENDGEDAYSSLTFSGSEHDGLATINASIINPYFHIPENNVFLEYWDRVEDRLYKIRHTLNIMGEKQPLLLFQPPIDPMALVNAVAGGGSLSSVLGMLSTTVPHYRFSYMLEKAKAYTEKVSQFGGELLGAIEKKDAEEMEILRNKQEAMILAMSTQIKEDQIKDADYSIKNLEESLSNAKKQKDHYTRLIDGGLLGEEETQIDLIIASTVLMGTAGALKVAAAIAYLVPQAKIGPFIVGTETGGRQIGEALDKGSDALETIGDAISTGGEIAGIYAQHKRSVEDWELQKMMAESEIKQLELQILSAQIQKSIAQRELQIHDQEIENNKSITNFMKNKFSNLELYNWMSSKLSGLFYQTYKMAHDIAKQAEKAFVFETGSKESDVNYIGGTYWDSQKKGLLSGETLGLDIAKMEKSFMEQDKRGMEITKNVSLLELDPLAFIQLKIKGTCEFRLTEELFDQDFPGHYNRQMKTISLAFDIGEGKTVNATLTQLNNKLVMEPDPKAVKYLLNPKGEQPLTIRTDWKVNEQIALSYVDQYDENNGMFELRYDDERYLPFEGTGAVSLWRLNLHGKAGSYNPEDLLDVTIKVRYTAEQGGIAFANAVKGSLKPYKATSFFDLAYTFPDQWNELMLSDSNTMELTFTRNMFPGMTGSKATGILVRYQYEDGGSAIFELNDELKLTDNQYLEASNLMIARNGSKWKFTVKGDKSQISNVEMVVVYKAKV